MKRLMTIAACAAILIGAVGAAGLGRTVRLFVAVVDSVGNPVLDMRAEEFVVSERGVKRDIAHVGFANVPMRIVLLVDTSGPAARALNDLRAGVLAFIDGIPEPHEIALVTTGRRLQVRVPPTRDRALLRESASGIFADTTAGTVMLDAVLESHRRFVDGQDVRWPVFVVVTTDGVETSPAGIENEYPRFIASLDAETATVHAIMLSLQGRGASVIHGQVVRSLVDNTKGHYEAVAVSTILPERLTALAARIVDQHGKMGLWYEIEFVSEAVDPQTPVSVNVLPRGLRFNLSLRRPLDQLTR